MLYYTVPKKKIGNLNWITLHNYIRGYAFFNEVHKKGIRRYASSLCFFRFNI